MDANIVVQSGVVRLRRTTEADADFVLQTEQDADNSPFVTQWSRQRHLAAIVDEDKAHLTVEAVDGERPAGYLILAGLTGPDRSIELMRIAVAEKRRGFGREALRLVARLAFETLGAHRLWLDVLEHNERARRLYESEGFVREGLLREAALVDERFESLIVMSMLEGEYSPPASR